MRPTNIIEIDFFGFNDKKIKAETPPPIPQAVTAERVPVKQKLESDSKIWQDHKAMVAKYDGKCSETGVRLQAGDWILYDFVLKLAYRFDSETTKHYLKFLTEMRASL